MTNASTYCLGHGGTPIRGFGPAPATQLAPYLETILAFISDQTAQMIRAVPEPIADPSGS